MDRKQTVLLIATVIFVFLAMAGAVYFSGGQAGIRERLNTPKRFTAKPGTDRDNALVLSSNKRPAQEVTGPPSNSGEPPIPVKSLSPPEEELSPEEAAIREALNSLDPEAGMEKLDQLLALPQTAEEAALLHAARAQLALHGQPPDFRTAASDFRRASELAPTSRLRCGILAREAQMWFMQDAFGEVSTRLLGELGTPGPLSPERMRLRALLALAQEQEGGLAEAEGEYRTLLREALDYSEDPIPEIEDLIRLAGLRLARIYRATGRAPEANDLVRELSNRLQGQEDIAAAVAP